MTATMLANHLWQSTIAAGVAWLLTMALRRNSAAVRYGVWLAASLKFLVPFALLVSVGSHLGWRPVEIPAPPQVAFVMDTLGHPFSVSATRVARTTPASAGWAISGATLLGSLPAIWLIGVLAVLVRWVVRWRRVVALVRAGAPADGGSVLDALRRLEAMTGAMRPLTVVLSDGSLEPGVFGILKPVLVWPPRIAERLADTHIEAILAHELAHVRRRDNLAAAAHMLVQAMFWFHPLVWWMGWRLVDERERACDEAVLQMGCNPHVYAEGILQTCQFYIESSLGCLAGVTGANLSKRIQAIMRHRDVQRLNPWQTILLATIGIMVMGGPVVRGAFTAPRLYAQLPSAPANAPAPTFEVASIKPNKSGTNRTNLDLQPGGRFTATNVSLEMLIGLAYGDQGPLPQNRLSVNAQWIGGGNYLSSDHFDIQAKADGDLTRSQLPHAVQRLLADRFKVIVHHETKELPIYALVLARTDGRLGPRLRRSTVDCSDPGSQPPTGPDGKPRCGFRRFPGKASGRATMSDLARRLLNSAADDRRPVEDRTGLAGTFEFELEWTPELPAPADAPPGPPIDPNGPSLFTALREQLGLKLDPQKDHIDVLVVDHAEHPTEN